MCVCDGGGVSDLVHQTKTIGMRMFLQRRVTRYYVNEKHVVSYNSKQQDSGKKWVSYFVFIPIEILQNTDINSLIDTNN